MDTIVTTALIGTGQQGSPNMTTGTPIDSLATQLAGEDVERRLLLLAGALTLYRQAGQTTVPATALPAVAAPETLQPCSVKVARIVSDLLQGEHSDLLPEAYASLEKARLRLPFELLPLALTQATRDQRAQEHVLPVLGERGRWLCQFNAAWSWVKRLEIQYDLPTDSETLWQEGTVEQRTEILRQVRVTDSAKALEWLKAVWKQEKADVRASFLLTLATGFSMADQPFLEYALDDRGESVRKAAAQLLTRLTDSPQALRLQARADDLLHYEDGKITVTLPAATDKAWMQDITMLKSTESVSTAKSYWLTQALSRVPPAHWEERYSITPAEFLVALDDNEWSSEVINALVDASVMHVNAQWFLPLIDWYAHKMEGGVLDRQEAARYCALLSQLPQREAESRVRWQLARQDYSLPSTRQLPAPWSDEFSAACVQSLKDHYHAFKEGQSVADEWASIVNTAAVSLAPSCFDAALAGWDFRTDNDGYIRYLNKQLQTFLQKISIRKRLIEEMR